MDVAALFSGGKDSTYALYLAQQSYSVKYLVSIIPEREDSWMYHSANIELTNLLSEALEIELITKKLSEKEELEGLKKILSELDISGVVSGAIASSYQKSRIDAICRELDLKHISPLWHRAEKELLSEIVNTGFNAIITSVSAEGFDINWLGREINTDCIKDLIALHEKYKINISGEGGEYESLVLNSPNLKKRLIIDSYETLWKNNSGIMIIKEAHLI